MNSRGIVSPLVLIFATFASGQQQPSGIKAPVWEPPAIAVAFPDSAKPTVQKPMIGSLQVAGLPIVLEETQLSALQSKLGGTIGARGDAGDALRWLCFHGGSSGQSWVLWLMSDEMDDGAVGGLRWQNVAEGMLFDERCPSLPAGSVVLPVKIRPGVPERDVVHEFGQPSSKSADNFFYLHEHDETIHNMPYTAMNTLEVILHSGAVWAIEVWKSTTS